MRVQRMQPVLAAVVLVAAGAARGDVIEVPGGQATIQAAIDSSAPGDEIVVAAGTYVEQVDFGGKAVTVRSADGAAVTTLSSDGTFSPVVLFDDGEGPGSVLRGFTITRSAGSVRGMEITAGSAPLVEDCVLTDLAVWGNDEIPDESSGAAARIEGGSAPSFVSCVFDDDFTEDSGGAIHVDGSAATITDCEFISCRSEHRGGAVHVVDGAVTVTGCTFESCSAWHEGGAIFIDSDDLSEIESSTFTSNRTWGGYLFSQEPLSLLPIPGDPGPGGALYVDGSVEIVDCTFDDNSCVGNPDVTPAVGGAVYIVASHGSEDAAALSGCSFTMNRAGGGGGIAVSGASPAITDCTIVQSSAGYGGGMFVGGRSAPSIEGCRFEDNVADGAGGGVYVHASSLDPVRFQRCRFNGNTAVTDGGGLMRGAGGVQLTSCVFAGNSAESGGAAYVRAGWYPPSGSTRFLNCTFAFNVVTTAGSSLLVEPEDPTVVANCILWWNLPDQISAGETTSVTYSDVQGGWPGEANIDVDPWFVDPDGPDAVPGTVDDDLHLDHYSPCVDAGDNGQVPAWADGDADGAARLVDDTGVADTGAGTPPIVDIGAHERQADSMPMEIDVHPGGSIQAAIDAARPGGTVQVHAGVYPEVIDLLGKAITVRAIDGPGTVVIDGTGLGTSVITCAGGEGRDTVLEGLTATGGTGAPVGDVSRGGGMYISGASPTLVSCVFVQNAATYGGGLYVIGGSSVPLLERCVFEDNTADSYGGGLYTYRYSYALLSECSFLGNSAEGGGGAVVGRGSFVDCAFTLNSAGSFGGAIHMIGSIHVDRCVFTGNEAMQGGAFYGGEPIELLDGLPYDIELTRCRFVGNAATGDGGAVYVWNDLAVTSCTLIGNTAESGGAIFVRSTYDAFVGNSVLSSNTATGDGGALHVGSSCDLEVTGCTITGNAAGGGGGGVWSDSGFALRNSIAWGNTAGGAHPQVRGGGGVRSSDVEGSGGSGPGWDEALGIDLGGNVDADPLLVDPDGADDVPGTADDDVRLGPWSPCLDAGDDTLVPADAYDLDGDGDTAEPLPVDLDGHARFFDDPAADTGVSDGVRPVVDMGAYERCAYCPNGIPADTNADGVVDVDDLVNVILDWGTDGVLHGGDVTRDGTVDVDDLVMVLAAMAPTA